jgi:outer membrane lipoprotein-sorting protein
VNAPSIVQRHPALRWLVPIGIACVAGAVATGLLKARASSETLPPTTPAALIAAVQQDSVPGFSGTVVSHLSLGLPELPGIDTADEQTSFASLLSGSHTLQIWYGGADKQRVALLGATDETDLFRNGRDVWQWSSATGVAVHTLVPARHAGEIAEQGPESLTPAGLAHHALAAMGGGTTVRVESGETVADRAAYELILTPRDDATKVGSVHIAVDGATKVPLGVQVYPKGSSSAAIDVAFTSIRFAAPAERNFVFTPPPNARVRDLAGAARAGGATGSDDATTSGSGWTTVVRLDPGRAAMAEYASGPLQDQLTPVSGTWGKGRLLDSQLLSVLVTEDGRVYAGAVRPDDLYAAADRK